MNIFKKVAIIFLLGFAAKSPLYSGKKDKKVVKPLQQICLESIFNSIRDDNVSNIWDVFKTMPPECCSKLVMLFYDKVRKETSQLFKLDKRDFAQLRFISLTDFSIKFETYKKNYDLPLCMMYQTHALCMYSDEVKKGWTSLWKSLEDKKDFPQIAAYCIKFFNLCLHADDLDQSSKKERLCALLNDHALLSLAKTFSEKWASFFCKKLMQLCDEFGYLIRVVPKGDCLVFDLIDGDRFSPSLCPYVNMRKDPTLTDFLILWPEDFKYCIVSIDFKNLIKNLVESQKLLQEIVDPRCNILHIMLDKEKPAYNIKQLCTLAKNLTSSLNKIPTLGKYIGYSSSIARFLGIIIRNIDGIFAIKLELRDGKLFFKVVFYNEVNKTEDVVLNSFCIRDDFARNNSFVLLNILHSTSYPSGIVVIDPVVLMLLSVKLTKKGKIALVTEEQAKCLFNFFKCWQALSSKNDYRKNCLSNNEIKEVIEKIIKTLILNFNVNSKKIPNTHIWFIKYLIFRLKNEKSDLKEY